MQKNWKQILDTLNTWKKLDDQCSNGLKSLCLAIAPNSYIPAIEQSFAQAYADGVSYDNKDISDWLSYYIWEVPCIKGNKCEVTDEKGRKYNFKKEKDVVRFFELNFL